LRVDGLDESRQLMLMDTLVYLPDDLLVKIDRAAMAFGLETRVPLLDHRLLEFAWRVRPSPHVSRGGGKWLLKQLLHRFVPESLVARPKQGFAVPLGAWLKGALRDWAEAVLDEGRLKRDGYFHHEPILFRWKQHLEAHRDWSASLWCVLMFGAWLDEYRTWK